MIAGTVRIVPGHMTEVEAGIEMMVDDVGREEERVVPEIQIGLIQGRKV